MNAEKLQMEGLSVSLKFPEALDGAGIAMLEHKGFSYKLWRINPDTNEKQIIAKSGEYSGYNVSYIEKPIIIHNAKWYFRIFPIRSWYQHPEARLLIFAGLCISTLIAFLVHNNSIPKTVKYDLQNLTRVLNRMAVKFLAQGSKPFDELMSEEIRFLADIVNIDRLSVWRNAIKSDELYTSQIYRWEKTSGTTKPLDIFVDIPYARYVPNWGKIFTEKEIINSPVRLLPDHEAAVFKAFGTVSIFVAPIFIDDVFWGVCFLRIIAVSAILRTATRSLCVPRHFCSSAPSYTMRWKEK